AGIRTFDASLAGLGGCPFAPKATGNIATEDLVYMFERSGISTGLDLKALIGSAHWIGDKLGRKPPAMVSQAGVFPSG
ncbi:MAG: hydroxymethylglutaryl-CoA lyase, partial [Sphingomonadales bacterium]